MNERGGVIFVASSRDRSPSMDVSLLDILECHNKLCF